MTQKLRLSKPFRIAFEKLKSTCDGSAKKLVTFFGDVPEFGRLAWKVDDVERKVEKAQRSRKIYPLRKSANDLLQNYSAQSVRTLEDEKNVLAYFRDLKFYIEKAPGK